VRFGRCLALLPVFGMAAAMAACAPANTPFPALTAVTLQLKFVHDAQFGGFYAADQNGYYQAEGLQVTLQPGSADTDILGTVLSGKARFGVAGAAELIPARAAGKTVRAIATVYRRNPTVFFALASAGITRPQDFAGKTIRAVSDQSLVLHAVTARAGIRPDQYTEVSLPSDLALFASGDVPVWGAYVTSLVLSAQQAGYKVNVIYPDDYGVHFYGDTIFATDDFLAKNPDLALRFLRASFKGWTYAVENPAAIGPMVVKYRGSGDAALEAAKMSASIPLVNTGEDFVGWMRPEIWTGMESTLREQGVLTKTLDLTQVYTTQFLREIYK
jgi:NitT/TauT family transport system substrate-binding protein